MEAAADLREKHATRPTRAARSAGDEGPRLCVVRTGTAAICERDIGVFWLDGPAPAAYRSQTLPPEKLSPLANGSPDSTLTLGLQSIVALPSHPSYSFAFPSSPPAPCRPPMRSLCLSCTSSPLVSRNAGFRCSSELGPCGYFDVPVGWALEAQLPAIAPPLGLLEPSNSHL